MGAKVIGIASVCPGAKVLGRPVVPRENPVPLIAAALIVTAEVPEDVSVSERALVLPSVTLPKLRLVVLSVSFGATVAVPVPERATTVVAPVVELLLIVN